MDEAGVAPLVEQSRDQNAGREEIRLSRLDAWAAEQGVSLNLGQAGDEEVRIFRRRWRARASKGQIAHDFDLVDRECAAVRESIQVDRSRLQARPRMAHGAAGLIGLSRNNLLAAVAMDDLGAEAVAEATLLLAQGLFAISQVVAPASEAHPEEAGLDTEFLRRFLTVRGGDSWLAAHTESLPEWMA